ncbi:PREDICTED: 26S proteasome non-ATPase regulatory subunit 9 [Ipomoea nil]|uniref:26S proteasome non-ATPase regulatory subunit 9 n=1 Tax=Ipomoea nil TaxID=35883 RepID=UPI000900AA44|nr:PREDICTED: 26S proteasome non-ATPase regulatory subunit 9 [Ipomoea nil]
MVGTNLKAETTKLMELRTAMELEMNAIIESLCCPGGPGLSGNLLDSEGFPREDVDIMSIRANRQRLAVLRNDHKNVTEKISQNIQVLHSARLASGPSQDSGNLTSSTSSNFIATTTPSSAMDVDIVSKPFALVDEITEASPAAEDGVQLGDQVVKFGDMESSDNLLQRLAGEAQRNQGRAISMVVIRQGTLVNLSVTPRAWEGRGLLGCHFRIL